MPAVIVCHPNSQGDEYVQLGWSDLHQNLTNGFPQRQGRHQDEFQFVEQSQRAMAEVLNSQCQVRGESGF